MEPEANNSLIPELESTIAALASGHPGDAAISLLRVSGRKVPTLIKQFLKRRGSTILEIVPRFANYLDFCDPALDQAIDDVIVVYYAAPASYTGEDLLEISCHASPYVVKRCLEILYNLGCLPATPGEFTKRAYLNGRIDLTRAEGIKELIAAQTSDQWLAARQLADGLLAAKIEGLRKSVIEVSAVLEALIDFPEEEDTAALSFSRIKQMVQAVAQQCSELLATYQSGQVASFGPRIAICGRPNSGKSTLLNKLLGKERALVSDIPGTTRDYIEEACLIGGKMVRLVDTAGLRLTNDPIEKLGIEKTREIIDACDLVIHLHSAIENTPDTSIETKAKIFNILSKSDLARPSWGIDFIQLSNARSDGTAHLVTAISTFVNSHTDQIRNQPFINCIRHKLALENACKCIDAVKTLIASGEGIECLAFEIQEVRRALESIIGVTHHEEILDEVFSKFCMGK